MSEQADVFYMTTEELPRRTTKQEICWNDPDLGIDWPVGDPKLSKRDKNWPRLRAADNNFQYEKNAGAVKILKQTEGRLYMKTLLVTGGCVIYRK